MRIALQKKTAALLVLVGLAAVAAGCAGASRTGGEAMDKGWVSREIFDTPPYAAFKAGYDTAKIVSGFVPLIRQVEEGVDVIVFFGGWCGDSKREVPRFLKLADEAGIAHSRVRFYALDRTKKSEDGLTDRYAIERIPTFIFLKDGREVGRITESPSTTLEGDVLTILARARPR